MTTTPEDDARLYAPGRATLSETMLGLDEMERIRCIVLARRMERLFRKSTSFDQSRLHEIYGVARDRAILDVADSRQRSQINDVFEWNDRAWKEPDQK